MINNINKKIKRLVITGPTGAIGMALINNCIEKGMELLLILNPNSKRKDRIPVSELIHTVYCSVDSYGEFDLSKELDNIGLAGFTPDAWIHLAWMGASGEGRNDMKLQLKNVNGMLDAMTLAKKIGCDTFVGAGSQAEYGPSNKPLGKTSETNPIMGYGIAKLCAYRMGRIRANQLDMRFIWTRIFSVYGPYDGENTMIMSGINKYLNGETPAFTKGEQQWDYLYSGDAAEMIICLAQNGQDGEVYPIGSGTVKYIYEYIHSIEKTIEKMTGKACTSDMGKIPYGANQVMYLCANISNTQEVINNIQLTSFEEGIRKTVEWCINEDR